MTEVPEQPPEQGAEPSPPPPEPPGPEDGEPGLDAPVDDLLLASEGDETGFARGEALGSPAANRIAAAARCTVIVLLGGAGSGKTTLLAAIYERFGLGPLNGHLFLGSQTLHGFERRCFRSCYGDGPGGELDGHTAQDAPPWLHLRVCRREAPGLPQELLLGDFSGEFHTKPLADGSRAPHDFRALWRADHVCVTVDGAKMSRPEGQEAESRFVTDLVENLLADREALADPSAISVIVTKWDLVDREDGGREAVEVLFARLRSLLGREDVGYLETAARSSSDAFQIGFGVGDLLARWTDRPALQIAHAVESNDLALDAFDSYLAPPSSDEEGSE